MEYLDLLCLKAEKESIIVRVEQVMKKFSKYWLPVIVWAVVIFTFSSSAVPKVGETYWQDFVAKKIAHIIEYALLGILFYRALKGYGIKSSDAIIGAIVLTLVYGFTDEFHQMFTPGREPKIRDVIIDTVGGALGVLSVWHFLPKAKGRVKILAEKLNLI